MTDERAPASREHFLIQSSARLNQALGKREVLLAIRDVACETLDAEAATVLLLDRERQRWDYHMLQNRLTAPDEVPALAADQGLAGWVAEQRAPVTINDVVGDPRLAQHPGVGIRSIAAVPVYRAAKVVGVLEIVNARRRGGFNADDLGLLEALGNQFSVALANARLYEMMRWEKRANELLNQVGLELARTLRLDELLPLFMDLLGELIAFDAVSIYLYHNGHGELEWFHGKGYPAGSEEKVRLKVGQGAVGWVAEHRQALNIPNVEVEERYHCARMETRSELTIPLLAEGELVGVFNLESDQLHAFGERDLGLLAAFGNQAAIAIQRAWLHSQALEKRRLEEEVHIARRIQRRLLPAANPTFPGLDIAAFNHPSREVSGDVYDFIEITETQLGILIGDVAGKGIPAGILMATFRASLRAEIRNNYAISEILNKVNRLMWESSEETDFVTAVYGVYDRVSRRLTYSNAGHNPPLLWHPDGRCEWLAAGGTVLGAFPQARYQESFLDLRPGDLLVFYTDGITEAAAPTGEMLGTEGLLQVLAGHPPGGTSREICGLILEAVHAHCRQPHMEDDLTAVVLRVI